MTRAIPLYSSLKAASLREWQGSLASPFPITVTVNLTPERYSETYAATLDAMIASPNVALMGVHQTVPVRGAPTDVDAVYGGGITSSGPNPYIVVTGHPQDKAMGADGQPLHQTAGEVLMHEVMSHGGPQMLGTLDNSITPENRVRSEIPGERQRARDPYHPN